VLKEREREFHKTEKGKKYIEGDKQTNRERESEREKDQDITTSHILHCQVQFTLPLCVARSKATDRPCCPAKRFFL
jgi:hypothetical protein